MHPRIAFYRKKDFGDNVEEEMLSILLDDIGYMKGGFERKRPLSVSQRGVKPLNSGLTHSMAKKWGNSLNVEGVNNYCIFPVYADEDMLSETATHMLSDEGRGLKGAAIKAIDFNPRIISVEVVGKVMSYSETVHVENISSRKGPFRVKCKRKAGGMEEAEFAVFDYALNYAKMQAQLNEGGEFTIYSTNKLGRKVVHGKITSTRDADVQLCEIRYLTQPVEGAKPIGIITVLPPRGYMFSGVVWE